MTTAPQAAAADGSAEGQFVAWVNAARRDAGLHELVVRTDLRDVSRRHSERMADRRTLEHNPNRTSEVCCWRKLGENVAYGTDIRDIHRRLMASSGHRANILSSEFTELGVGVELRDGVYWVTQLFRLPEGASAPAPSPPDSQSPPPAKPGPAPAPTRAPPSPDPPPPPPEPAQTSDRLTVMLGRVETLESDHSFGELVAELDEVSAGRD